MALDPVLKSLVEGFTSEARELTASLTRAILSLESAGSAGAQNAKSWETLARGLHTLKGSAATLGLDDLATLAHTLEDRVAPLRANLASLPAAEADALLRSLDGFNARLKAHAAGNSQSLPPLAELLARLPSVEVGGKAEPNAVPAAQPQEVPELLAETPSDFRIGERQVVALLREVERLRELRLRLDERQRELEQLAAKLRTREAGIDAQRGEARTALLVASRAVGTDAAEAMALVSSLEEEVKGIFTLPVRTIVDPLERHVRDLCRQSGKRAQLSTVGGEISIDRTVLDALRGPLLHLVRNAVDHGIETPSEREARGKHGEGAIVVRVEQQGNLVFVEVSDDGNGIDIDAIRKRALEKQLLPRAALEAMDDAQARQLIFMPGFSTREEVTETSGRGVGLDVVRAKVQSLEGSVEVQSTKGQGTRFVLAVPTQMGSSPLLIVRSGEQRFGVPMLAVTSVLSAGRCDVRSAREGMRLYHGGELIPLKQLGGALSLRHARTLQKEQAILVVKAQGQHVAVAVDEVQGDRDLAIRPLPPELRQLVAYQGAATLAGGELLLVVKPGFLAAEAPAGIAALPSSRRALVIDDSLTARALHRSMLEAGGYVVHLASNAKAGLEQLRHDSYDVVVCDVGMEGMNGFEFARSLRASTDGQSVPLILVSMHDDAASAEAGLAAGADSFVSKRECVAGRLLREVTQVIARRRGTA